MYSNIVVENTIDSLKLTMNNQLKDDSFLEYVFKVNYTEKNNFYRNEGKHNLYKRHDIEIQQSQITYTNEEIIKND